MVLNWKREGLDYTPGANFSLWGGKAQAQVAQRNCGWPISNSFQGQDGCSSEQPGLVEEVPSQVRVLEVDDV